MRPAWTILAVVASTHAATVAADSDRGAQLFESLHCVECHSVNGRGAKAGPDLGQRIDRNFTPASLAATMWNHAPTMWAAMSERNLRPGDLDDQAANDLFAYFYAARFFERPGDAGRGKALFSAKHCAVCHGISEARLPAAKPVAQWESIGDPVALVNAMWNHGVNMREEFARRKLAWPDLTAQDLTDMLVYLRNLPAMRNTPHRFAVTAGANGQALFASKTCSGCHTGKLALPLRLKHKTMTEIGVAMWNHEPKMAAAPPRLDVEEMRELISYLWAQQFFEDAGNAAAGERVFNAKHCAACHSQAAGGAPQLLRAGSPFSSAAMVAALWHHGPRMLHEMQLKGITWPRFNAVEVSNLIAYLNSQSAVKKHD